MHTKQILTFFSIFFLAVCANAGDVYKTTDANGNIIYTDTPPTTGAQPVDLPEPSTYSPVKSNVSTRYTATSPKRQKTVTYESVTMTSPANEQTFRSGSISISVNIAPSLSGAHSIQFLIDGKPVGAPSRSASMSTTVHEVHRGSHTASAQIIDNNGKVVTTSDSVTFHIQLPAAGR